MVKYDPKSARAEEFIHHGEILDTLTYAAENTRSDINGKIRKKRGKNFLTIFFFESIIKM